MTTGLCSLISQTRMVNPTNHQAERWSITQNSKREIPEGWGVEKLKDKLSVSRGISYKTENIKDNIGTPMINLASIDINRNYKSTGLKYFNGEYLKEKIVSGGDLLIACTDLTRNADIVGSPIIVPFDEQKYVFSMDLAKIDSKVDYINKYYLYSTLRMEHYHNYIKNGHLELMFYI